VTTKLKIIEKKPDYFDLKVSKKNELCAKIEEVKEIKRIIEENGLKSEFLCNFLKRDLKQEIS